MPVARRDRGFSAALAAAATLAVACSAVPAKSPLQARADVTTAAAVVAALNEDPVYFFRHVDVSVTDGVVCLSGLVWTDDALLRAEEIARRIPGVTRVEDRMELEREPPRGW